MNKITRALTGNEAAAEAMRQINPDVVAAYPITPQTEVVQIFSSFVADGVVDTVTVPVESEHSAMSAAIGAAAAGARAMTATSSQGLALMWEMLYIASGLRLPIVMPLVNRSLSAPINIHCDHSDAMGARDAGWIQLFSEDAQEAYWNLIQAVRIAEHPEVLLPVTVCFDGFITSHAMQETEVFPDEDVRRFVGTYKPEHFLLNTAEPITMGALDLFDYFFEHKRSQAEAMRTAAPHIAAVEQEFARTFEVPAIGSFETYRMEDAEFGVVVLGSTAGTARTVVDDLRAKGTAAGLLKLRVFRPFPAEELAEALRRVKAVAVMDRAEAMSGQGGPLYAEIRSALYDLPERPVVTNYVYGLGGRDVTPDQIHEVFADAQEAIRNGRPKAAVRYIGVRE